MADISNLKVNGRVVTKNDEDYDKLRKIFFGGIDSHPAAIVLVENANDVAEVINFTRENKVELAIRSGGHSTAGHCTSEGGIVLDLRNMKKIEIDDKEKTAWAETGLTAAEFGNEVDKHDLVLGFGDTGSVGIGGITLGGGVGFLIRKFGMTIDSLLAAEIVTADGKVLTVDEKNNPGLFWAIRGGGGNFGVVTKFKFQLHDLSEVYGGMLILPAEPELISKFIAESWMAPDELSSIINVMPSPPMPFVPEEYHGKIIAMIIMMYAGDPKEGEKAVAPFRALAKPIADMIKPMRYKEIFQPEDDSYHPTASSKNMFMKSVDKNLAETMLEELNASNASLRVVQMRVLGGAMAKVDDDATAFAHRKCMIMTNVAAFYEGAEDQKEKQAWVDRVCEKLYQGYKGAYVNFIGDEGSERIHDAYPEETYKKLSEIKKKYDPTNLFKLNQNIAPAV